MNCLSVIDQSANLLTINHMSQTHLYKIPLVISVYPFRSKAIMNKQQLEGSFVHLWVLFSFTVNS